MEVEHPNYLEDLEVNHLFCNRFLVHRSWVGPLACTLSKLRQLWLWHVVLGSSGDEGMAVGKRGIPEHQTPLFPNNDINENQLKPLSISQYPIVKNHLFSYHKPVAGVYCTIPYCIFVQWPGWRGHG